MKKFNHRNLYNLVVIFSILFLSSAFELSKLSGVQRMLMYGIFLIAILLIGHRKSYKFFVFDLVTILLLIFLMTVTSLVNIESYEQIILNSFTLIFAFIIVKFFNFDSFNKLYLKVITFLSIVTIIQYFLMYYIPSSTNLMYLTSNIAGREAYSVFFSTLSFNESLMRAQSIFWEAGAYAFFIFIAYYLLLYNGNEIKHKKFNHIILIIAMILTFSTTGYISLFLLIITYNIQKASKKKTFIVKTLMIFGVTLLIGAIVYRYLPDNIYQTLFGKIFYYFETGNYSSTFVRLEAINQGLRTFLRNPIFGVGMINLNDIALEQGFNMNTFTLSNWFAGYGVLFGLIMSIGMFRYIKLISSHKIYVNVIIIFTIFILAISTQDFSRNPILFILVFYGLFEKKGFSLHNHYNNGGFYG